MRSQNITLRDLVKPELSKHERAAISRALKSANKAQEEIRRRAAQAK